METINYFSTEKIPFEEGKELINIVGNSITIFKLQGESETAILSSCYAYDDGRLIFTAGDPREKIMIPDLSTTVFLAKDGRQREEIIRIFHLILVLRFEYGFKSIPKSVMELIMNSDSSIEEILDRKLLNPGEIKHLTRVAARIDTLPGKDDLISWYENVNLRLSLPICIRYIDRNLEYRKKYDNNLS